MATGRAPGLGSTKIRVFISTMPSLATRPPGQEGAGHGSQRPGTREGRPGKGRFLWGWAGSEHPVGASWKLSPSWQLLHGSCYPVSLAQRARFFRISSSCSDRTFR